MTYQETHYLHTSFIPHPTDVADVRCDGRIGAVYLDDLTIQSTSVADLRWLADAINQAASELERQKTSERVPA